MFEGDDGKKQMLLIGGAAAALVLLIVGGVIVMRLRASSEMASPQGGTATTTTKPATGGQPSARPAGQPAGTTGTQAGATSGSTAVTTTKPTRPTFDVSQYVNPKEIGVVKPMTTEEKRAMNLPIDQEFHYKWVQPTDGSPPVKVMIEKYTWPANPVPTTPPPKPTSTTTK